MSTSDGFRQWNKISGTKACYWGVQAIFGMETIVL